MTQWRMLCFRIKEESPDEIYAAFINHVQETLRADNECGNAGGNAAAMGEKDDETIHDQDPNIEGSQQQRFHRVKKMSRVFVVLSSRALPEWKTICPVW